MIELISGKMFERLTAVLVGILQSWQYAILMNAELESKRISPKKVRRDEMSHTRIGACFKQSPRPDPADPFLHIPYIRTLFYYLFIRKRGRGEALL
jgi:hypothetical protein